MGFVGKKKFKKNAVYKYIMVFKKKKKKFKAWEKLFCEKHKK